MFAKLRTFLAVAVLLLGGVSAGGVSTAYASGGQAAMAAAGAPTLLGYINYLVNSGQQLSGVTPNIFSATPLDSISFGSGGIGSSTVTWAGHNVTVGSPNYPGAGGSATGLTPAIINTFVTAPLSAGSGSPWFYNTSSNASPNDWFSLSTGAQAAGKIVDVVLIMKNPAGSGNNPFTSGGGVLNPGSTTNLQLLAYLATTVPDLKTLQATQSIIISLQGELNLTGGYTDPQCWFATGAATSLQAGQIFQLVKNYYVSQGITNALWAFETNAGVGNYLFGFPGPSIQGGGWSGDTSADLIFLDGTPLYFDSSAYAAMQLTGLPMAYGSAVPAAAGVGAYNIYTGSGIASPGIGLQQVAISYPKFFAYILWSQYSGSSGTALNYQLGALQALSTSPFTSTVWPGVFSRAK